MPRNCSFEYSVPCNCCGNIVEFSNQVGSDLMLQVKDSNGDVSWREVGKNLRSGNTGEGVRNCYDTEKARINRNRAFILEW